MLQLILKGIPNISGLLLTFLLSYVLDKRTSELAYKGLLIPRNDDEKQETLVYLLNWRDLISAVLTGLFVLQFSAATKISSKNPTLAAVATITTVIIIPLMILSVWLLSQRLELVHVQTKRTYWLLFLFFVVPFYVLSLIFVYV